MHAQSSSQGTVVPPGEEALLPKVVEKERGELLLPATSHYRVLVLVHPHLLEEIEEAPVHADWLALMPLRRLVWLRSAVRAAWPGLSSRRVRRLVKVLESLRAAKAVVRRVGDCVPLRVTPEKDNIHTAIRIRQ